MGCAEEICPPDNRIEVTAHIRKCASETRYSAIFKSCFPPHNTEFDECRPGLAWVGLGAGGIALSSHRARNLPSAAEFYSFPYLIRRVACPCLSSVSPANVSTYRPRIILFHRSTRRICRSIGKLKSFTLFHRACFNVENLLENPT